MRRKPLPSLERKAPSRKISIALRCDLPFSRVYRNASCVRWYRDFPTHQLLLENEGLAVSGGDRQGAKIYFVPSAIQSARSSEPDIALLSKVARLFGPFGGRLSSWTEGAAFRQGYDVATRRCHCELVTGKTSAGCQAR